MCGTCGCGQSEPASIRRPGERQDTVHDHIHLTDGNSHHHHHDHSHENPSGREIILEADIMRKNDLLAERNRGYFDAKKIKAFNLVSSPGSGKTTILERTIKDSIDKKPFYIIEGDQQTMLDAERISKTGVPVVQVNTGSGCHLDAQMVSQAVKKLEVAENALLMIENVGNLVCPALFDLGETKRIVILSVTEGDDKPLKYPNMFQTAHLCLINKSDLLPYVDFNIDRFRENATHVNHHLEFITISAKTGEGFDNWVKWLLNN